MSQENVEALRALYAEWGRGNFWAGADLFDPDVLFIPLSEFPSAGRYIGTDGMRDFMRGYVEAWRDLTLAAEDLIEAENSVVAAVRQRGVGKESGAPLDLPYFSVWTCLRSRPRSPRASSRTSFTKRSMPHTNTWP